MSVKSEEFRLIPLTKEFLENKKIKDKIWTFLQLRSYIGKDKNGEEHRFIYKDFSLNSLYQEALDKLGNQTSGNTKDKMCSYNTFSSCIKELKNINLIQEGEIDLKNKTYKVWYLNEVYPNKLIPKETLEYLYIVSNINVIKIYSWLYNAQTYKEDNKTKFTFTKELLAQKVGYTSTSYGKEIGFILESLQSYGLIEYHISNRITNTGKSARCYELDIVRLYRTNKKEYTEPPKQEEIEPPVRKPRREFVF